MRVCMKERSLHPVSFRFLCVAQLLFPDNCSVDVIVIHRPSVQKSIEYKFTKVSLFIASIMTQRLCSLFLFLWLCFTLCSVVYFAV